MSRRSWKSTDEWKEEEFFSTPVEPFVIGYLWDKYVAIQNGKLICTGATVREVAEKMGREVFSSKKEARLAMSPEDPYRRFTVKTCTGYKTFGV